MDRSNDLALTAVPGLPLVNSGCDVVELILGALASNNLVLQAGDVLGVAQKIVSAANDFGIPTADVVVDPLVMPIGAMGGAGRQVFHLVRRLREELGVNTTCGASNVSFGLPNRHLVTGTFLSMAMAAGMTSGRALANAPNKTSVIRCEVSTLPAATPR